jgi:uncharacterized protein
MNTNKQNRFGNMTAAAGTGFAMATLVAAVVLGLVKPKDPAASRWGVFVALVGLVSGGAVGLVTPGTTSSHPKTSASGAAAPDISASLGWKDWRNFIVVRKVKESEEITSFYLKPQDMGELPGFQPGQFLTLKLEIPGQVQPVTRTYSLSNFPEPADHYRISVKRELAPKGADVLPGLASNYLHDQVHPGDLLVCKPPGGRFTLDLQQTRPVVLISNGVGITPMLAMAAACCRLKPNRPVWFVHGARNGQFHAFEDEILALAQGSANLQVHFAYSQPRPEDQGHYHSNGYVSVELLQQFVEQGSDFFLCGSPSFMQSLRDGLQGWGVDRSRVFYESFSRPVATSEKQVNASLMVPAINQAEVGFSQSGQTFTWTNADGTLLEFAEAHGLEPDFSCRAGICGTCMCKLAAGEVTYEQAPTAAIETGSVLICIAKPGSSSVVLDL